MKFLSILLCLACVTTFHKVTGQTMSINRTKQLIDSLYVVDQQVQQDIINEKVDSVRRGLFQRQFATFRQHKPYLVTVIDKYGFPGYDQVGKETSNHFFILVQHCDDDPSFQKRVLSLMKPEVERNNADTKGYAYLTDRVLINSDKPQLYGTQVTYKNGRAVAGPVADVERLDQRRAEVGLEPIDSYLQKLTQMHQAMNNGRK